MQRNANCAAILAAGGLGSRFNKGLPAEKTSNQKSKQFLQLRGQSLYSWSLRVLALHESIANVVVVVPAKLQEEIALEIKELSGTAEFTAEVTVVAGGSSRQESVYEGLKEIAGLKPKMELVLVHDAARPFLDKATIDRVIEAVITHGACTVGGAVSDTIKKVRAGKIIETLPREHLVAVQTPQAARFEDLLAAHEKARAENYASTDDAALLEWAGQEVCLVKGPDSNLKVTEALDLILAEALSDYLLRDRL